MPKITVNFSFGTNFEKSETIVKQTNLKYGEKAHMERTYKGKYNSSFVDLSLKLEVIPENPNCIYVACGDYNLVNFQKVVKIKKTKGFLRFMGLSLTNKGDSPDLVYEEGNYQVYVWKDFSFNVGNIKHQNIFFSYSYELYNWWIWSWIFLAIGLIIGVILNNIIKKIKYSLDFISKKITFQSC